MAKLLTIEEMRTVANHNNGKCLSSKYINSQTKLLWECSQGHRWYATPNSIRRGSWCPTCRGIPKKSLDYAVDIAKKRGGKCLSNEYKNNKQLLEWECSQGHRWRASLANVDSNETWCPYCYLKNESFCRYIFETIFQKPFKKVRPKFLIRNGKRLELDGYNKELRLAFEYQGRQHYENAGGKWDTSLDEIQLRDQEKTKLCEKEKIDLILIPYSVKKENLPLYIYKKIKQIRRLTDEIIKSDVNINDYDMYDVKEFKFLKDLAIKKGGKLISKVYLGSATKLIWECEKGHRWEATPNHVKEGSWCPKCAVTKNAKSKRLGLELMHKLARKHGGKCLSKNYTNSNTELKWKCKEGHVWNATPNSVRNGHWCPMCAGNTKKTIEDMYKLAKQKRGTCLSKKYTNVKTKLLWECEKGHRWESTPEEIIRGQWCPHCSGKRQTIEDMRKIARERKGKCLSKEYMGVENKLLWECEKGHRWEATPHNVKRGSWCPICYKEGIKNK